MMFRDLTTVHQASFDPISPGKGRFAPCVFQGSEKE